MNYYGKTDIGRVRVSNQDAYAVQRLADGALLAVVCDGMGGANAGNIASAAAVRGIVDYVNRSYRADRSAAENDGLLYNALLSANIEIYDRAQQNPDYDGMGTTAVAALVKPDMAVIAHVGDSRAYRFGTELTQLTRDHSVVQDLLESGKLTPEEAKTHPRKNVITRALGTRPDVLVDCAVHTFAPGEALLLCTDGLTNFLEVGEICEIFKSCPPERVVETLVARANHNGGGDNITAVTVFAGKEEENG